MDISRVAGLASGLDTESMIKELMKAERKPLDNLMKKKQLEEWRRDDYRELNLLIASFRNNVMSDMRLQRTFLTKSVSSSNDSVVSAKQTGTPGLQSYLIKDVILATEGTPHATSFTTGVTDPAATLNNSFDLKITGHTGVEKTINVTATDSMKSILSKINSVSADTGVVASFNQADGKLVFTSTKAGKTNMKIDVVGTNSIGLTDYDVPMEGTKHSKSFATTGTISSNFDLRITGYTGVEQTITVDTTDTIDSIVTKINSVKDITGVEASNDNGNLIFTSTKNGETYMKIDVDDTNSFGLTDYEGVGGITAGVDGVPGQVTINGTTLQINSNTFTYDGMEFTFKQPTVSGQTYKVSLTPNEDAVFDTIKNFVDEYNKLIDKLNSKISEARYRDYQPLTDEEKEALDEKVIEKWEEKAKSGLLRRDPIITDALSKMRGALYTPVSGMNANFDFLSEIGISTTKPGAAGSATNYLDKGKLYIDETKLREAIRENPTEVMDLFTKKSSSENATTKFEESGVAQRLYDLLGSVTSTLTEKAGLSGMGEESDSFAMGREMESLNDQIERWERRLQDIENRYWRQFTALENAMNRFNSQSAWLTQQLSG